MKGLGYAIFVLMTTSRLMWSQTEPEEPKVPPVVAQSESGEKIERLAASATQDDDTRDRVLYSDETERLKPLTSKLGMNILMDQKDIWTSPFHIHRQDWIPWVLVAGGTAALIASDQWTAKQLPNTADQVAISKNVSNLGAAYTVLPVTAGLYIGGAIGHNPKARETGILGGEAVLDSLIVASVIKVASRRARPLEGNGKGDFFQGGGSFPSGHAAESWALASVVAHEYNKNILYPITAYGLASLVSFSRLSGRQHFASDIFAGSAMGWFVGRHVFKTHVDHAIHRRPASKLSVLRPQVFPQFEPESRTRGITLSWSLAQ
jgi:membrane-associated phospholipid phosphatase